MCSQCSEFCILTMLWTSHWISQADILWQWAETSHRKLLIGHAAMSVNAFCNLLCFGDLMLSTLDLLSYLKILFWDEVSLCSSGGLELPMSNRLASDSQRPTCLRFLIAEIKGVCPHPWPFSNIFNLFWLYWWIISLRVVWHWHIVLSTVRASFMSAWRNNLENASLRSGCKQTSL